MKAENTLDLHLSDIPPITDSSNDIQKATTEQSVATEPTPSNSNLPAMDIDIPTSDKIHGVTDGASSSNNNNVHATISNVETNENVELNGVTNNTKTLIPDIETNDGTELNGVTNNIQTTDTKPNESNIKGVTDDRTQVTTGVQIGDGTSPDVDQTEPETLPDLVSTQNIPSAYTDTNTTEDKDEAAEALLQLSKSDTIPEDDIELPLGVLPVDAAPVPITLGNEDVLNAIENFKNTESETTTTKDKRLDWWFEKWSRRQ